MSQPSHASASASRRQFLQSSAAAITAGAVLGTLAWDRAAHAAGASDTLRVGLVGCGGRGTGAAQQALDADPNVKLVAMADAFADRLRASRDILLKRNGPKVDVPEERCFVGFDAYRQLIDSGVDVVLLATPPHFRPAHLKACIEAGKHVFCEKPVAVDAPGVRSVLQTVAEAERRKLSIVSGLCWRYDAGVRETMQRVHDGAIGELVAIQENYLATGLWHRGNDPSWSPMEYQMRNWLYFTWLSGDHNVEQHVHSLDKAAWAMHEEPPLRATGLGGRQARTDEKYGHIYDHHAVVYEYANGVRLYSFCRQQDGTSRDVSDLLLGTTGTCDLMKNEIRDRRGNVVWRYTGPKPNMFQVEHNELFASIRSGKPINNGLYMTRSTMLAILGRMATYTGQTITWEQAINSREDLTPDRYHWGEVTWNGQSTLRVATPGLTPFV